MALTARQEQVRDLLVRREELRMDRAKLARTRDAGIEQARAVFGQARDAQNQAYAAAAGPIDAELGRIEAKLAGAAEISEQE